MLDENKDNSNKLWKTLISLILNEKKSNTTPRFLTRRCWDQRQKQITETFNKFFSTVRTKHASAFPFSGTYILWVLSNVYLWRAYISWIHWFLLSLCSGFQVTAMLMFSYFQKSLLVWSRLLLSQSFRNKNGLKIRSLFNNIVFVSVCIGSNNSTVFSICLCLCLCLCAYFL